MSRPIDVVERVGQWKQAFDAIRGEITPQAMRDTLAAMDEVKGVAELGSYMSLARNVMANDRTAMIAACMLVTSGIRPLPVDLDEQQ